MLPGLLFGLLGLVFGVGAALAGSPVLAVLAATASLLAAGWSLVLFRQLHDAEEQTAAAVDAVSLRHYELFAAQQPHTARSCIDPQTGLPDERFFELALEGRVAAARRHLWPLTLVLVDVTADPPTPEALAGFAGLIRRTLREADIACRLNETTFAMLLEDTAEEGGVWTAERLQIGLAKMKDGSNIQRISAGVASYPSHALRADEVLRQARTALTRACAAASDHGLGPVEVARVDLG
jgi:GGDEF domain-containing protein